MAEEKKNGNGKMGDGMMCSCGYERHWTFFLLRTLLTIIILMVVFWFGVVAGRLGDAGGARGYMMRYGYATPTTSNSAGGMGMPMIPAGATSTSGAAGY
jgi:hypothetical protein